MKYFGDNLRDLRQKAGYNQTDFAKLIETTQQAVSDWELNVKEPGLYSIIKILKALNCTFEELVYEEMIDDV